MSLTERVNRHDRHIRVMADLAVEECVLGSLSYNGQRCTALKMLFVDKRIADDFLDRFTAQKRKKIKRERKRVVEAGIELEVLSGHEATDEHWRAFHRFYRTTFERHSGYPTLTEAFFHGRAEARRGSVRRSHGGRSRRHGRRRRPRRLHGFHPCSQRLAIASVNTC